MPKAIRSPLKGAMWRNATTGVTVWLRKAKGSDRWEVHVLGARNPAGTPKPLPSERAMPLFRWVCKQLETTDAPQ